MEANQGTQSWYEGLNEAELTERLYEVNQRFWDLQDALGAVATEQAHIKNRLKEIRENEQRIS